MFSVKQNQNNTMGLSNPYVPEFKSKKSKKSKWGPTSWQQEGLARLFEEQKQYR